MSDKAKAFSTLNLKPQTTGGDGVNGEGFDLYPDDYVTELEATATRLRGLLRRANMALLCYTQSHGTPHTQLMDEIAEELGLDADGNTLKELADAVGGEG